MTLVSVFRLVLGYDDRNEETVTLHEETVTLHEETVTLHEEL